MRESLKTVDVDKNGNIVLRKIQADQIMVPTKAVMSIDGATGTTGIGILRESDGALYYSMAITREKDETPVQYKVRLKRFVYDILIRNPLIEHVFYEEPFIGYAESAKILLMLRTFIEELTVEHEPAFNYLKHIEINNMKWKRLFLAPTTCPPGTELQKEYVRHKLLLFLPFLSEVTQDECDAIAMGYSAIVEMHKGSPESLESKKKVSPFKYEMTFIGAEADEDMIEEFMELYTGPKKILENGIVLTDIKGTTNFEKAIYETMGHEDKVLILKFSSNKHGNLILQYRIGHLASSFPFLYAIIWRKNRK